MLFYLNTSPTTPDMPLISVVIPAFNVENYIGKTIESILKQSYKNWELIIVNDGSTDDTYHICAQYAQHYPGIHIINIENSGMSMARNTAIDVAKGDYITFIDADDLIHPQLLETLLHTSQSTNADICSVRFEKFHNPSQIQKLLTSKPNCKTLKTATYTPIEAIENALYQKTLNNSVWGKLYKSNLFDNLRFQPGIGYEDLDIFYKIWIRANKIVDIHTPLYYYRQHPASYLHNFNIRRTDVLKVTSDIVEWCYKNCKQLLSAAHDRQFSANYNMLILLYRHNYAPKARDIINSCIGIIKKYRKEELSNPKVRLKNKSGALLSYIFFHLYRT